MKIAALQGGGTRGKWQAVALANLEARLGVPLFHHFDLIAGTSVGAINGGLLAAGLPAAQVNAFYDQDAPDIFTTHWYDLALNRLFKCAKYSPDALEKSLQSLLGDRTLADCKTNFLCTAVDMATGRNVYFQSYGRSSEDETEIIIGPDSSIKLWQCLRASSAAQTYFPGYVWINRVLWDGGSTGCNAPDMLALTEALTELNAPLGTIEMLSLGAGASPWGFTGSDLINPTLTAAVKATLEVAYACGEVNAVWQARLFLGARHTRWNPKLPQNFAIDDASAGTLNALAFAAKQFSMT